MTTINQKMYEKRMKRINKATNNGKCWWLHQALTYLPPKKKEKKWQEEE